MGLSSRSARGLLDRFGSLDGVAGAVLTGQLDEELKTVAVGKGGKHGASNHSNNDSNSSGSSSNSQGSNDSQRAGNSGGNSGSSGSSNDGSNGSAPPKAPAQTRLAAAQRNAVVTCVRRDPDTVPWAQLQLAVQRWAAVQQQQQAVQQAAQCQQPLEQQQLHQQLMPSPLCVDAGAIDSSVASCLLRCHPHNVWHVSSSEPYVKQLASRLGAVQYSCSTGDPRWEQRLWAAAGGGLLADLLLLCRPERASNRLDRASNTPDRASNADNVGDAQNAGASGDSVATRSDCVRSSGGGGFGGNAGGSDNVGGNDTVVCSGDDDAVGTGSVAVFGAVLLLGPADFVCEWPPRSHGTAGGSSGTGRGTATDACGTSSGTSRSQGIYGRDGKSNSSPRTSDAAAVDAECGAWTGTSQAASVSKPQAAAAAASVGGVLPFLSSEKLQVDPASVLPLPCTSGGARPMHGPGNVPLPSSGGGNERAAAMASFLWRSIGTRLAPDAFPATLQAKLSGSAIARVKAFRRGCPGMRVALVPYYELGVAEGEGGWGDAAALLEWMGR